MVTYKTPFFKRCEILGNLWLLYREEASNPDWVEFFSHYDISLPMAYLKWQGWVTVKKESEFMVNDVWGVFCGMCLIDPFDKWDSVEHIFDTSNAKQN